MHSVETDYFHTLRYLYPDPLSLARSPPLLIKNRRTALVQETDSIDIAITSLVLTNVHLNSRYLLFGIDWENLGVKRSSFDRVDDFTFNVVQEGHFDLVEVSIGLISETAQLDFLVKRQFQ